MNLEWLEKERIITQRQILTSAQILTERIRDVNAEEFHASQPKQDLANHKKEVLTQYFAQTALILEMT